MPIPPKKKTDAALDRLALSDGRSLYDPRRSALTQFLSEPKDLGDVLMQPLVAASGLVSRFGEGAARRLARPASVVWDPAGEALISAADKIRDNQSEVERIGEPTTTMGRMARIGSEIGIGALPYLAAGAGAAGLLRSAAMTGIESASDRGSLVKGLSELTGNDALQRLAASPWRGATDVGIDLSMNLLPGAKGAYRALTKDVRGNGVVAGARQLAGNTRTLAGEMRRDAWQAVRANPATTAVALDALLPGAGAAAKAGGVGGIGMGAILPVGRPGTRPIENAVGQTMFAVEAVPGSRWSAPTARGIAESYPRTRALYSEEQLAGLRPVLEEVDKHFKLEGDARQAPEIRWGLGSYDGHANVNALPWLPAEVLGDPLPAGVHGPVPMRPVSDLERDAVARGLAIDQRQNAVPWMRPMAVDEATVAQLAQLPADRAALMAGNAGQPATGLAVVPIASTMSAGQAEAIAKALQAAGLPHNFTQVANPDGTASLIFGNFTGFSNAPVSDQQMVQEIAQALNGHPVWEALTPGQVQPYLARAHGNYLGDNNAAQHLRHLGTIANPRANKDAAAQALAGRLRDFFDRNTDRRRAAQGQIDRAFQPGAVFDRGIQAELRRLNQSPASGLDAPYDARGLHPSLLERGDSRVPLLNSDGKPNKGAVPSTTSGVNIDRSLQAIDEAFAKYPNPVVDPKTYKKWGSMLFGPVIPKRPVLAGELQNSVETLRPLMARLDQSDAVGPARPRSQMGNESDEGLKLGAMFDQSYKQGAATPVTSLMLYSWGALSKRASVAPHETAFLDLLFANNGPALQPILERVARGTFDKSDHARLLQIAKALPDGAFSRQVTSNINALAGGLEKMAKPAPGGRMVSDGNNTLRPQTNAERWHEILADRSVPDEQYLREFQRLFADTKVGIDNKVASFIALVTGRRDLIVPDRVQLGLQWQAPRDFANSALATNVYEKGGLAGLFKGAQGVAMQEAIQRGLRPSLPELYRALGRPSDGDLGRMHWETWVAQSDQEVGHGSLGVIGKHAAGEDISNATSLVKEGQLDKFRYGELQGVVDGRRVYGFYTSDGQRYEVPREQYLELSKQFKKLAPKGFSISQNTAVPFWQAAGYPAALRDASIKQVGTLIK